MACRRYTAPGVQLIRAWIRWKTTRCLPHRHMETRMNPTKRIYAGPRRRRPIMLIRSGWVNINMNGMEVDGLPSSEMKAETTRHQTHRWLSVRMSDGSEIDPTHDHTTQRLRLIRTIEWRRKHVRFKKKLRQFIEELERSWELEYITHQHHIQRLVVARSTHSSPTSFSPQQDWNFEFRAKSISQLVETRLSQSSTEAYNGKQLEHVYGKIRARGRAEQFPVRCEALSIWKLDADKHFLSRLGEIHACQRRFQCGAPANQVQER